MFMVSVAFSLGLVGPTLAQQDDTIYKPGNGVSLPKLVTDVRPNYTADAMRRRISGAVLLQCVVDREGVPTNIEVVQSLDEKQLAHIVDIQLQRLDKRLAQQQLSLEVDRAAKQLIAKEGLDPQFGARPLKRAIQDLLLDPLATKLLVGDFKPGDRIKVTTNDGELEFEKAK